MNILGTLIVYRLAQVATGSQGGGIRLQLYMEIRGKLVIVEE